MKITNLKLLYFRNYNYLDLNIKSNLNIFIGDNGQGKTNILEAIYLLAFSKSFRTKKDIECIKFENEATCISCVLEKENLHTTQEIMLAINQKGKNAKISGVKQSKITDFVGTLNVVLFSPEDLNLVKGSPAIRREFLDREFFQFSKIYHKNLLMYRHLLKQRNAFLKTIYKEIDSISKEYLKTLTMQLSVLAEFIINERLKFIDIISKMANESMAFISDNKEKLTMSYKSSLIIEDDKKCLNITKEHIYDAIMNNIKEDTRRGSTKIGPHNDDIIFYINNMNAKQYASQGQQRTITLSLKLAEIKFLKNITGYSPLFLLDDVLSELDDRRQKKLFEAIDKSVQTFITAPNLEEVGIKIVKDSKIYFVNNGDIRM